jgi:chaperonin cofactor prefoldin
LLANSAPSLSIIGTGMRVKFFFLAMALAVAAPAMAQPAGQVDAAACKAEEEALEQDIALARSRGQMLRRRELAEALAALQARCKTLSPAQSRAARIERLEREIRALRLELERAEEELRELTRGG